MNTNYKPHLNNEIISPAEFINEYESGKKKIERSVIIPPKLGEPGFGKIFITYGVSKNITPGKDGGVIKR